MLYGVRKVDKECINRAGNINVGIKITVSVKLLDKGVNLKFVLKRVRKLLNGI